MNHVGRWLVLALLLFGVGWLLVLFSTGGGEAPGPTPANPTPAPIAKPDAPVSPAAPVGERRTVDAPSPTPITTPPPSEAQGVRGTVVDPVGQPLPGISIYLLESQRDAPLQMALLQQQGLLQGPVAATQSAADGTFAVGLPVAVDTPHELHFVSFAHADTRVGDLRFLPGVWHDLGPVTMQEGITLQGRVTVEGTTAPVPDAVVTLTTGTAFDDLVARGLPGREHGFAARVDATGRFELRNAPPRGMVTLHAVAPGFARVTRRNLQLQAPGPVNVDFALPPGSWLGGRVVDGDGRAIDRARVEAWPERTSGAPTQGLTRPDGQFELLGLLAGSYRVRVQALGFQEQEQKGIPAGRRDLRFTLPPRAMVQVRALGPDGPLRDFRLAIRRCHLDAKEPGEFALSWVTDLPEPRIQLAPHQDHASLSGVPLGLFVAEVTAQGLARSWSAPFEVKADTREVAVDVPVTVGASLRGQVTDAAGQPVAGATVSTQAAGTQPDNSVWRMLAQAAPDRVTRTTTTTDAAGQFTFTGLAFGNYQLQVDHAESCRALVGPQRLAAVAPVTMAPIRLQSGAEVVGRASVGGKVGVPMKVVLTSVVPPGAPAAVALAAIRLECATDANGGFRMPRRVPPGTYELRAAAVGAAAPDDQAIRTLLQMQRSAITFHVVAGQRLAEPTIDLPADH